MRKFLIMMFYKYDIFENIVTEAADSSVPVAFLYNKV